MSLFKLGKVKLHSGMESDWKIECDALNEEDWGTLAKIGVKLIPSFREVLGVPQGGLLFADALREYATKDSSAPILVAEDVVTTGDTMTGFVKSIFDEPRFGDEFIGITAFSRGKLPDWVQAIFILNSYYREID